MERLASHPDPWTNLWTSWTLDHHQNTDYSIPISPTTSKISQRLDQKKSGLFDNDSAGFNPKDDAGKTDLDLDNFKLTDEEEFALGFDEMGGEEEDVAHIINKMAANLPGEEYLESFMDLSFLLQGMPMESEDIESCEVTPNPQSPEPVKRKLDDVVTMEMEVASLASIDHDYVAKKPRLATVVDTAVEEVVPSTASATKPSPVEKYRERREKNNVASKRSREIRKMKFKDMEVEAVRLTDENEKLRVKIDALEKMAKEMKAMLIHKLAGKD